MSRLYCQLRKADHVWPLGNSPVRNVAVQATRYCLPCSLLSAIGEVATAARIRCSRTVESFPPLKLKAVPDALHEKYSNLIEGRFSHMLQMLRSTYKLGCYH